MDAYLFTVGVVFGKANYNETKHQDRHLKYLKLRIVT